MRHFAVSCAIAALVASASPAVAAVKVGNQMRDVQLSGTAEASRLSLQFRAPPRYRFFMLDAPRRAVLDLQGTGLATGRRLPAPDGVVKGLRAAARPGGTLRLVIELPAAATARVLPADGAPRLVLELASRNAAGPRAPAIAAGTPAARLPAAAGASMTAAPAAPAAPVPPVAVGASSPSSPDAAGVGAPHATAVRAAHAPAESGRAVIVAIDAGHGGQDPGAIGGNGTREKDVVLEIARVVAARINREPGMRAVLTRQGDYFLTLRQRIKAARDAKADMFVSIHADSVRDRAVSGASVYVLSEKGASDEQSRWLAERENAADLKGGVSLDDKDGVLASVLLDLSQSASIASSMQAAERVLRSIDRVGDVRKSRVQQAGFVVLKSPDIPSMLVETAYISNPADERLLRQSDGRGRLAEAIFLGVHGYFSDHPPEGTQFAALRRALPPPTAQLGR